MLTQDVDPQADLVVFDLETTGLSPACDEILQIAAVRMRHGKLLREENFFSYVRPSIPVPYFITSYTGIKDSDVRRAPEPERVLTEFSRFVGSSVLIAHNGHRFDMKFLEWTCNRKSLPTRKAPYLDSITLSQQLWGRRGVSHGLDAVLERLAIRSTDVRRHDARGDVVLLARAIQAMQTLAAQRGGFEPLATKPGVLPGPEAPSV